MVERSTPSPGNPIARIGTGGLGGKARGLTRIREVLADEFPDDRFPGIRVEIPGLSVIASDLFDEFVEGGGLREKALDATDDHEVADAFRTAELPSELTENLRRLARSTTTPVAVRSSSLLEDALTTPFAGVYGTKMIPNNDPDPDVRLRHLADAVKFVYASTFFSAARDYIRAAGRGHEDEKMAIIVQEVVGKERGGSFYPELSGVGRSYNFYPVGKARRDQGVVNLALGLGKTIVEGGRCWTYSPAWPAAPPPFNSPGDALRRSQVRFWAVNLAGPPGTTEAEEEQFLIRAGLDRAESDGSLHHIASTYDPGSDRILPGTGARGPRMLDFAPLLTQRRLPFNEVVSKLLESCERALGVAVEIEFALNLGDRPGDPANLSFLQVRPMVISDEAVRIEPGEADRPDVLASSDRVLGNGTLDTIRDVVYVDPVSFEPGLTRKIAAALVPLNRTLVQAKRPYLLIGFGRWGSADPWLGIPVQWGQISGAAAIIEATLPEMDVEASQGSHFFQNLTSFRVSYFTVRHDSGRGVDWDWLAGQERVGEPGLVRHVRLEKPLVVKVDGRTGRGLIRRREVR